MSYEHEKEMQQARNLVENYNQLSDDTREKLANGVEWLAFLQKMASTENAYKKIAPLTEEQTA